MIVVGIVGLLASVAMGAYTAYVTTAKAAKVSGYYTQATRFVGQRLSHAKGRRAGGLGVPSMPATAGDWIVELVSDGGTGPEGGPPYVAGVGDPVTGAIGIAVSGTFGGNDLIVTVSRPAYAGFTTTSASVALSAI